MFRKLNCAAPTGSAMVGESSSLTPTLEGSGEKTELGVVSHAEAEVTQADYAPLVEVAHPAGKAGAVAPSKFWEKTVDTLGWPSRKEKVSVPRIAVPSCNWSEAVFVPPQIPVAVKLKGRASAVPLVETLTLAA